MCVPSANTIREPPDWLHDFRTWMAGLSPGIPADPIDVLSVQLGKCEVGDHAAVAKAAETVRGHGPIIFPARSSTTRISP
jgi:hypothetical protein